MIPKVEIITLWGVLLTKKEQNLATVLDSGLRKKIFWVDGLHSCELFISIDFYFYNQIAVLVKLLSVSLVTFCFSI